MLILEHDNRFKRRIGRESDFQEEAMKIIGMKTKKAFHVKNEGVSGKKGIIYGAKMKKAGVRGGVADIICVERRNGFNGLAIELKCGYNTPSDAQVQFLADCYDEGWCCAVVWCVEKFVQVVEYYFRSDNK